MNAYARFIVCHVIYAFVSDKNTLEKIRMW